MKKRKSKIINLSIISLSLISILGSSALILASCSSNNSNDDKRINKGNGENFASTNRTDGNNVTSSLKDVSIDSVSDEKSMKSIINGQVGNLFYNAIERIANENATYKRDLENKIKELNDEFDDLIKNARDSHGSDWEMKLQDNSLDQNGGTKDSYISKKKNEWALTYFSEKVFQKSLVYVQRTTGSTTQLIKTPQLSDLMNALNKTNGFSFIWKGENELENFYAGIQQFVFEKWLEFEKPLIVNMSLWKYGTPNGGINSIYNTNLQPSTNPDGGTGGSGSGATKTQSTRNASIAGTYEFPFFSNSSNNEQFSSIEKFNNFVSDSRSTGNYKLSTIGGITNSAGLIDIPQNYTDDSSTYILAKTSSIYNDLYPEFAMATLSLFYDTWAPTASKLINPNFSKELTFSTSVLDEITKQFISTNSNSFNAAMPKTTIPTPMVNEIINQFGSLTTLRNNPLYTIDSFKIRNQTTNPTYNLSDFMLLRNSAGVHAISIDGYDHVKNETTAKNANLKYGDVIIYRHILQNRGLTNLAGNTALAINLHTQLSEYFNANVEYLMSSLLQVNTGPMVEFINKYFSGNFLSASTQARTFYTNLSEYLFNLKNNEAEYKIQDVFRNTKTKYSNNFGTDSKNNGFAAPWIYNQNSTNSLYNITNIYKSTTPIYGNNSYRKRYIDSVEPYINSLNISPLTSNDPYFKYSQYIYSNNFYLNLSINSFMKDGKPIFADKLKSEVLSRNVQSFFETNQANAALFMRFKGLTGIDLNTLNYQWINTYFSSVGFDRIENNKFINWMKYNSSALSNNHTITQAQMQDYKTRLFMEPFNNQLNSTYKIKYDTFLVASTINYLLEDHDGDGLNRFMEHLQNQISFGRDYYFVWSDGLNGKLESTNRDMNTTNILNTNRLNINQNNNYASKYFSNSGTLLTNNAQGSNIYSTSIYGTNPNHYNVMQTGGGTTPSYLGYHGLQTVSNNSLPSVISQKLFNSSREGSDAATTSRGLLYQYGSKENLINHIDSIKFISDLESLANDISGELQGSFDIDSIKEAQTIDAKKTAFKSQLDSLNASTFQKFEGVVSTKILPDSTTTNYYGAYAKQINYNDVNRNFATFVSEQGANIAYNLLIRTAMEDTYKNIVLNQIVADNKFDVFDLNAKEALGTLWVKEDENKKNK